MGDKKFCAIVLQNPESKYFTGGASVLVKSDTAEDDHNRRLANSDLFDIAKKKHFKWSLAGPANSVTSLRLPTSKDLEDFKSEYKNKFIFKEFPSVNGKTQGPAAIKEVSSKE